MKDKLNTIRELVLNELEQNEEARADDFVLIAEIYRKHYGVGFVSFYDLMTHHSVWKLPSFETIRRCRQKVQEERIDLRADKETEARRINMQRDFIEFAKGE